MGLSLAFTSERNPAPVQVLGGSFLRHKRSELLAIAPFQLQCLTMEGTHGIVDCNQQVRLNDGSTKCKFPPGTQKLTNSCASQVSTARAKQKAGNFIARHLSTVFFFSASALANLPCLDASLIARGHKSSRSRSGSACLQASEPNAKNSHRENQLRLNHSKTLNSLPHKQCPLEARC